jgi:hypothetical protein
MKRKPQPDDADAIDLVEEAVHLLRLAPVTVLALYAVGTLPFVLAFLYFWAEMSRGAFAAEHAGRDAIGMALVFLWMKCWQAVFACELRARVVGQMSPRWTWRRLGRLALTQAALQPAGLFAIPLAGLVVLPVGWVYGFFQNVTVLADGSLGIAEASKASAAQASWRPGQSFLALAILSLFAFFVWANVAVFLAVLPSLLKTFLGIDTAYTRAGSLGVLNTTWLAATVAISYLCVDPLAKAIYILRCFYGRSVQSGDDLAAELSSVRAQAARSLLILLLLAGSVSAARGEAAVSPSQLNSSIDEVQKEPEFSWRMPREKTGDQDAGQHSWIVRLLRGGAEAVVDGLRWAGRSIMQTVRWIGEAIRKLWPKSESSETSSGSVFQWASLVQTLLLILIAAIVAFLVILMMRAWGRRRRDPVVMAEVVAAKPDLTRDDVSANQLPEQEWLALARELMAQGNLRLALRALYLAGLAHLAARELISVAIFKSNREYENELRRRGRAQPETLNAFSQNVAVFDCVWYGRHDVTADTLQEFEVNLERIRAC